LTNHEETADNKQWPWWRLLITVLNIFALVLSTILSWHYLSGGSMVGCSAGSSCDQVLNSQWSTIAGIIPISGLAMGLYLALFVASLFIGPATELSIRHLAWSAMLLIAGSVAGSAIWFTILQKWFIGHFCPYCMTTHITGLLLAVIIIWRAINEYSRLSSDIQQTNTSKIQDIFSTTNRRFARLFSSITGLSLVGFVLAGILATLQVTFKPPMEYSDGKSQEILPTIDYNTAPLVGSPDAPYIVTLLFDYQCPHCQKLHFLLNNAIHHYNGKLAFVLCPAPLNAECNPYIPQDVDTFKNSCELAKIGLAVWIANREAFPAFENWMFSFESGNSWHPRSIANTREKAVELIGQSKLDAALSDPWIEAYLQTSTQIYGQTIHGGNSGVPKLIYNSRWVIPEPHNTDDLIMVLQKSLAIPGL
jgi:uncharacterized membrane protein/protein-disulfide isomerase